VSFDKKEFKRNLAGSVSYPPVYTVVSQLELQSLVPAHILAGCPCVFFFEPIISKKRNPDEEEEEEGEGGERGGLKTVVPIPT
jgi:hypothetical protein